METTAVYDKIFDFAYTMAFRDATMRRAFTRRPNEKEVTFRKRKEEVKQNARKIVKKYTDAIIDMTSFILDRKNMQDTGR